MSQTLYDDLGAPVAEELSSTGCVEAATQVRKALARHAHLDANTIDVGSMGTEITLTGTVRSWAESNQACHVAWSVPGVTKVVNLLRVV
ncbi:BON domain-containing protein [Monashia sp. NPDC004114]